MTERPAVHDWAMHLAEVCATRSTCVRRAVGCILLNVHNEVLATGVNGVPRGTVHCIQVPCAGAGAPTGQSLDLCLSTHAEMNALIQCRDIWQIAACYVTTAPCVMCIRALLNTGCQAIYFAEEYAHVQARDVWQGQGRLWVHLRR